MFKNLSHAQVNFDTADKQAVVYRLWSYFLLTHEHEMLEVIPGQEIAKTKRCEEGDYTLGAEEAQKEYQDLLVV